MQDAAFETPSEIPDIVAGAQRYVDIYKEYKHHTLELRTFGLFRAILRALRNVMEFFADSKMSTEPHTDREQRPANRAREDVQVRGRTGVVRE